MIFGYRGGIRPINRKNRTKRKPLAELEVAPKSVTLFLKQSTEAAAEPVVTLHQKVREGECIASAQGDGVPVFASVAGRVTAIELQPDLRGRMRPAIVLEVIPEGGVVPPVVVDWQGITPMEIIHMIQQFGLVEQVGDPVPLHMKVMEGRGKAEMLIINGTECQPYMTATHRLGLERGRDLVAGAQLLARILGVNSTVFAITGDQITAIERLERDLRRGLEAANVGKEMRVKALPSRYPLYHDNQIVRAVTGREIPPGGAAVDVGCQVFSLAATCALGRAFIKGQPVTRTALTVSGFAVVRPRNLWAPLGVSFHNLLENCGGVEEEPALAVMGGLLTGERVTRLRAPVEQNTRGLLCLLPEELPIQRKQETCLQCGRCIGVCPMGLCPVFVNRAIQRGNMEKLAALHPQDCISCGACASVCPSQISLLGIMKQGIELVREVEVAE